MQCAPAAAFPALALTRQPPSPCSGPLQAALQQRLQELGVQEGASEASLAAAQVNKQPKAPPVACVLRLVKGPVT